MSKQILNISDLCTGCMACYNSCPVNAISMKEDLEGFWYPQIDEAICTDCMACEKVCPEINKISKKKEQLIQSAYYGWHNEDIVRKKSSSGGAFSALADWIVNKNGIVFGAVYDNSKEMVIHKSSQETSLDSMRKSKYVQSYIGDSFKKAERYVEDNRYVFFTGTPCQIAGLSNYIGNNRKNLITCDFICHGVPPMKLLKDDLALLEKKYKKKIDNFDFRPKIKSWSFDFFSISLKSNENKKINIPWRFDRYFKAFIDNLTLRKSCYRCKYSNSQHASDITLADYWGYRRYDENIFDNRGLSLILANTMKGKEIVEKACREKFTLNSLDWVFAEYVFFERNSKNYNLKRRDKFFLDYINLGYEKATKKHGLRTSPKDKLIRRVVSLRKTIKEKIHGH